jgi:hypothetical protein
MNKKDSLLIAVACIFSIIACRLSIPGTTLTPAPRTLMPSTDTPTYIMTDSISPTPASNLSITPTFTTIIADQATIPIPMGQPFVLRNKRFIFTVTGTIDLGDRYYTIHFDQEHQAAYYLLAVDILVENLTGDFTYLVTFSDV